MIGDSLFLVSSAEPPIHHRPCAKIDFAGERRACFSEAGEVDGRDEDRTDPSQTRPRYARERINDEVKVDDDRMRVRRNRDGALCLLRLGECLPRFGLLGRLRSRLHQPDLDVRFLAFAQRVEPRRGDVQHRTEDAAANRRREEVED